MMGWVCFQIRPIFFERRVTPRIACCIFDILSDEAVTLLIGAIRQGILERWMARRCELSRPPDREDLSVISPEMQGFSCQDHADGSRCWLVNNRCISLFVRFVVTVSDLVCPKVRALVLLWAAIFYSGFLPCAVRVGVFAGDKSCENPHVRRSCLGRLRRRRQEAVDAFVRSGRARHRCPRLASYACRIR